MEEKRGDSGILIHPVDVGISLPIADWRWLHVA